MNVVTHWQAVLGARIRHRRRELELSQAEVAARCGISESRLQQLELGSFVRLPKVEVVAGLAAALDIPMAELLALAGYGTGVQHD